MTVTVDELEEQLLALDPEDPTAPAVAVRLEQARIAEDIEARNTPTALAERVSRRAW